MQNATDEEGNVVGSERRKWMRAGARVDGKAKTKSKKRVELCNARCEAVTWEG